MGDDGYDYALKVLQKHLDTLVSTGQHYKTTVIKQDSFKDVIKMKGLLLSGSFDQLKMILKDDTICDERSAIVSITSFIKKQHAERFVEM